MNTTLEPCLMLGIAAALALWPAHAQAQEAQASRAIDIQNFQPVASPTGLFATDSNAVQGPFVVSAGLVFNFAKKPLELLTDNTSDPTLIDAQLAGDVLLAVGIAEAFELGVGLPVYLINDGQTAGSTESASLGDLRLRPRVSLLDADTSPVGLGLFAQVGMPTGDDAAFTSSGSFYARPGLIVDTRLGDLLVAVNLAAHLQEQRQFASFDVGNQLVYSAGAAYPLAGESVLLGAELFGSTSLDELLLIEESPLEGLLGIKWRLPQGIAFEIAGSGGLVSGFGAPAYRIIGGVRYAEYSQDWDKDGFANNQDDCPRAAEDEDGFKDDDGCPDPDNDGDAIRDIHDACPEEREDEDGFEDGDGCPEPDNDNDAVLDKDDACPNVPGDRRLRGCPNADRDRDSIANDDDVCPDTPGVPEFQGCPVPDQDKDGIFDRVDRCPDAAEDKDGFKDDDGCPEPDNDNDGICDPWVSELIAAKKMRPAEVQALHARWKCTGSDACHVRAGRAEFQGCPSTRRVIMGDGRLTILDKVMFAQGTATIANSSHALLDELANVLVDTPGLRLIEIQGHTDDLGDSGKNVTLSQDRASAVRFYLVARGVAPEILIARGYGDQNPAISIEGKKGKALLAAREANRRVQFVILEQEGDAPSPGQE